MKTKNLPPLLLVGFFNLLFNVARAQIFPPQPANQDPHRSLMVDQFIRINNPSPQGTHAYISPEHSILSVDQDNDGIFEREEELLKYCDDNHITHLILYDTYRIFNPWPSTGEIRAWDHNLGQNLTLREHFCRFIHDAKTNHHITEISINGGGGLADVINASAVYLQPSPVMEFTADELANPEINSRFLYLTDPINNGVPKAELAKFTLRVLGFGGCHPCDDHIDYVNYEDEFWHSGGDFFGDVKQELEDLYVAEQIFNSTHIPDPIKLEMYIHDFVDGVCPTREPITAFIDGTAQHNSFFDDCSYNGGGAPPHPRVIDRINLTYYLPQVQFSNWIGYLNINRVPELRDDSHNDPGTTIYPLINAEDRQWGGYHDFLGKFFRSKYPETQVYGNYFHNIFNSEANLYQGYVGNDLGAGSSNIAYPGGATWFAASQMCGKIFDPDPAGALFPNLRNRRLDTPVIFTISEGISPTDPVAITYQGPIEQVTNFTVDICDPNLTVLCNLLTVPATALLTGTSVWPNSFTVPLCQPFNAGHYLAVAHITYSNGYIYEQREHFDIISTSNVIKIVNDPDLYEGDPSLDNKDELTVCDGQVVTIQGRPGAAWFRNGQVYDKGTVNLNTQYLVVTESGLYEQTSTNVLEINFLRNPQIQILATASGGPPDYDLNLTATTLGDGSTASTQYIWTTGETTQSIVTGYTDYSTVPHYHVTVTQDNGCIRSDKFAVKMNDQGHLDIAPPTNGAIQITVFDDICGTAALEGKLEIDPQTFSFAADYSIFIEPGNDTIYDPFSVDPTVHGNSFINIYDLPAGDYTIQFVFSGYGNVFTYSQAVQIGMVGGTPYTYTSNVTQLSGCNLPNGQIALSNIQPAGTTLTWSPFGQNTTTISNLDVGTYRVDFMSPNNCPSFDLFTIDPPPNALRVIKANVDDETCNGSDGEVHIATPWGITGGASPYDISLTGQVTHTNVTSANWTGLDDGDYTLTVTDNNGCSSSIDLHVGKEIPISVVVEQTPASCTSPDVDVLVHVCDGLPGYTIDLDGTIVTGVDEHVFTISPGTYTLTVIDDNNPPCTYVDNNFVVAPPNYLAVTITATGTCQGASNGTATAVTTGGTPPYSFSWSNGATIYQTMNLSPGSYSVTVTDADGCTAVANTTITQSSPINIAFTSTPVCIGGNYGAIDITPTGGTTPYAYFWQPIGAISEDINGLTPATYTVQVTDANGCTNMQAVDIVDITCCGNFFPSTYTGNDFSTNNNVLQSNADLNTTVAIPLNTTITIKGAQIAITAGVNIIVKRGAVLNITDNLGVPSKLFACGDMWGGIVVEPGGKVNITGNSIIADAERGVYIQQINAPLLTTVTSNIAQFQSCYEGIFVQPNSIGAFNSINLTVVHTGFYTPYPLKNSANFIVGTTSYAGIELNNIITTIGSNAAVYNWFYNLNIGIISTQSRLTVVNSDFTGIRTDPAYTSFFNGSGIYARGDNSIYLLQFTGHGKYGAPCFLKCDYGVYVDGVTGYVRDSHIGNNVVATDNVQHGINITNLVSRGSFLCSNNYIECIWSGIDAYLNPNGNEIKILENQIDVNNPNASGYGIAASELFSNPPTYEISNNEIYLDAGHTGIEITGAKGLKVTHNLIFMSNSTAFAGIAAVTADKNFFVCNEVTGADGATPNINHNGFYIGTSQKNYIRCNRVNLVSKGFQFDGYCKMDELFLGNTMETCWRGLNINIDGVIGVQHNCGNIWSGPFTDLYPAYNGYPGASTFWVNFGDLPPYHPAFWPVGFFQSSAGVHYGCSDDVLCDGSHARIAEHGNFDQFVGEDNHPTAAFDEENRKENPGMVQFPYALVYPNPSDEQIVINWFLPLDGKSTLTIFNSSLEIVASYEIEGKTGSKNIDVLNFQSGFYVYSLIQNGVKVYSGKFSIIH